MGKIAKPSPGQHRQSFEKIDSRRTREPRKRSGKITKDGEQVPLPHLVFLHSNHRIMSCNLAEFALDAVLRPLFWSMVRRGS